MHACALIVFRFLDSPSPPKLVSRKHSKFTYDASTGSWTLIDLDSVNGTFVNDMRIKSTRLLCVAWIIHDRILTTLVPHI